LLLAAVVQGIVLLIPTVTIAGLPLTLASLTLAIIAVLLHLAASTQSRTERPARHASTTTTTTKPQRPRSTASPAAGREAGTVKWFNTSKGFGFISRDSGDDVFVHFRAIRGEGHRVLVEGQRVEFTIMMRDKGLQAEDVVPA
jgi:CspA family cold shock protein